MAKEVEIVKEEIIKITYPEEAATYTIQMINAAAQSIKFESILISEDNNTNSKQVFPEISELFNANPHQSVRNLIFVEPSQLLDFPLTQSAIAHLENVVIIHHWSNCIMANLLVIKNYIIDEKKVLAKIEVSKSKPKKQSKFQKKMAEMMEQAEQQKKAQQKRKK